MQTGMNGLKTYARGSDLRHQPCRSNGAPQTRRVLWIHGYTLNGSIWNDIWQELPEYDHFALDLPGHGRARRLTEGDSAATLADHVLGVARTVNATDLVGLSFGGTIGLQAAIQAPDFFDNVVLSAPGLIGGPEDPGAATCNQDLIAMARERGIGPWLTERWMSVPPEIFAGVSQNTALWQRLQQAVSAHQWDVLTSPILAQMFTEPQKPRSIARIRSRISILSGDRDMASFLRCAELIRRAQSSARRFMIIGGCHLCLLTHTSQCAQLIDAQFREAPKIATN